MNVLEELVDRIEKRERDQESYEVLASHSEIVESLKAELSEDLDE